MSGYKNNENGFRNSLLASVVFLQKNHSVSTGGFFPFFFLGIFVLMLLAGCQSDGFEKARSDDGIVAKVGRFDISDDHFRNELLHLYYRTGQALNLNPELRRTVVDSRLDRYTIVEYAKEREWHLDLSAQNQKERIRRKVLMEEFERRFIHDGVTVGEQDLRTLFSRINTTLRASHLYFSNRAMADSAYHRLQQGESFGALAREVFQNPHLAETGGDLGYFTVDDMDIAFEDAAYQLEPGEISPPVKTSRGYSIIKVTDRISTPLLTETQYSNARHRIQPLARDQKKELATRNHMNKIIASFEFNSKILEEMWHYYQENKGPLSAESAAWEPFFILFDEEGHSEPLIDQEDFTFTWSDFWEEFYYSPGQERRNIRDAGHFRQIAEGLAYRAYALGLVESHPAYNSRYVERAIEETFYDYMIQRFNGYIDQKVTVTETEVKQEFAQNSEYYMEPLELNLSEITVATEEQAERAWMKIRDGARFSEVLKKYTIDREALSVNGELGYIPITQFGMMAPALGELKPGEVAGPFQLSSHRFVIFKCNGRKEPRPVTLEEAAARVENHLHGVKKEEMRKEIIQKARAQYNAEIFTERLNRLPIEL